MMLYPLLCLAAPYGLYFFPYGWVLAGTGALSIIAAMPVMFSKDETGTPREMFVSTTAFFAVLAINRQHPMLAYAALALWGSRRIFKLGRFARDRGHLRLAAVWASVFAPLALTAFLGEIGFLQAAFGAVVMVGVASVVPERFVRGLRGMTGEASAAALMSVLFTFRSENLAFLNSPLLGIVYGALCGVFFYRFGLLDRLSAWVFAFCAVVMFIAAGRELFVFYLLFLAVFEMGKRLPHRNSEGATSIHWAQRAFIAASVGATATAVVLTGASDPFPFLFSIAGAFSAAVFSAWAGWGEYLLQRFLFGFWGAALLAACGWGSSAYPAGAAPLVMLAGFAAAGAYYARGVLASPEKDQVWLEYAFGALTGMSLFKAFARYLA